MHAHRRVKAFECNLSQIKKRVKVCLAFIPNNLRDYDLVGFSECAQSRRKLYRAAEYITVFRNRFTALRALAKAGQFVVTARPLLAGSVQCAARLRGEDYFFLGSSAGLT